VREGTQARGVGEGEAGFPRSREPDAGLHPRTLGSCPEPEGRCVTTEPPRHPCMFGFKEPHGCSDPNAQSVLLT